MSAVADGLKPEFKIHDLLSPLRTLANGVDRQIYEVPLRVPRAHKDFMLAAV